jgi:hypothetical protein
MKSWSDPTLREKGTLFRGKLRRLYLVHLRPRYVERSIARRQGQCNRTGACCNLLFRCPLFTPVPLPACRINSHKPKARHAFPIDERDLRDRDVISPDVPCGFSFPSGQGETPGVLQKS